MKEVNPKEALNLMQGESKYIYLDVRSVPEFEQGHPEGAINIPIMHFAPGAGMTPNPDFVAVVEANVPKDARLLVGCKTGGRSARACEILAQLGYQELINVRGGFVGAVDQFGRLVEPGWSMLNLPATDEAPEEATYEYMLARTRQ